VRQMLTNKKWRAACAAAATMLSMAGSAWAQTQTFSTFSDDATVALWLFDDGWYAHTNLLDASVGMYDLRLLKGDLIDGKYGGALLCSADAETFNAYFAGWPGAVAPKKMRGPDGQPSGLWGPTLTPTRLIDALAGEAWTCEFWVLLTRPPKTVRCCSTRATLLTQALTYASSVAAAVSQQRTRTRVSK